MTKASFFGLGAIGIIFLLALRCTNVPLAAGSSEHGNALTVVGTLVDSQGAAAVGARVRLLPPDFNPIADSAGLNTLSAATDDNGRFRIERVPEGAYCLNGVDGQGSQRLLHQSVIVSSSDSATGTDTLRRPGSITMEVSSSAASDSSYVYIPGTDLYAMVGTSAQVTIAVPQAIVAVNFAKKVSPTSMLIAPVMENIVVHEGRDTTIAGKLITLANESNQWRTLHPEWLWCDDFEASQDLSAGYADTAGNGMSIDSVDAFAGRYALRQHYAPGQVAAGWTIRVDTAGYPDNVFMRFYHKLEKEFSGESFNMGSIRSRERSGSWSTNYSFALNVISGVVCATLYGPASTQANSAGYLFEDKTGFMQTDSRNIGRWVLFEMELQLNTPGAADGACRVWIDDSLRIERTGVDVRGADTSKINEAMLSAYFNSASPKAQSLYYDDLVIAKQKIGPARIVKFE